jgi:hypothetical protein
MVGILEETRIIVKMAEMITNTFVILHLQPKCGKCFNEKQAYHLASFFSLSLEA